MITSGDSPSNPGPTHSSESHSSYVEISPNGRLKDIPKVPQVDILSLLDAVFPPVPADYGAVCQKVRSTMIQEMDKKYRWKCMPQDSTKSIHKDSKAFRCLSQIFEGICKVSSQGHPAVTLKVNGNRTPVSCRTKTSRPDTYVCLLDAAPDGSKKSQVDWADIIMPLEFKKKRTNGNQYDDFVKVLWSMYHIMRNDPRRRFAYGITIENTSVRLWFNDRCGLAASTPFDINEDWEILVRIIVAILRASVSELGYDVDMQRVPSSESQGEPQYDITVRTQGTNTGTTVYRTVEVLSDVAADGMLGRGTRVWKAQRLLDGKPHGPYLALKDVWMHTDRVAEHEIIDDLKQRQGAYAQYFLTVVAAGFVPATLNDPQTPDDTRKTIRRGKALTLSGQPLRIYTNTSSSRQRVQEQEPEQTTPSGTRSSVGEVDNIAALFRIGHRDTKHLNSRPRRHYRIVFKEVGTPVYKLRSYSDVLVAIRDGSEGLHAIHLTKLVHRDVSSGNIMLVKDDEGSKPRGVIMDFEYVRDVVKSGGTHNRPGTTAFMAVEVMDGNYNYSSKLDEELPAFRQNALHDLESIWWICMHTIFYLVHPEERRSSSQHRVYHNLFKSSILRSQFWETPHRYRRLTNHLSMAKDLVKIMKDWSDQLKIAYTGSYKDDNFYHIDVKTLEECRTQRHKMLSLLEEATKGYPFPLKTLSSLEPLTKTPPTTGVASGRDLPEIVIPRTLSLFQLSRRNKKKVKRRRPSDYTNDVQAKKQRIQGQGRLSARRI